MKLLRRKVLLALPLAVVLFSCSRRSATTATTRGEPDSGVFPLAAPSSRDADDIARFLAGLPARPGSPYLPLESLEAWRLHRTKSDEAWAPFQSRWSPPMRSFQRKELSDPVIERSILFYPFSGPDSLLMTVFFPRNPIYVMVGLEPAGTLPSLAAMEKEKLDLYLAEIRHAVDSELHRSFFVTREMDGDFRGQVTDGLLPPIVLLLVRSGHTILGYRHVRVDDRGIVVERAADYRPPVKFPNRGVQVDFVTGEDRSVHKLFYFSVNLADQRLGENKAFQAFLSRLDGATTYMKATSYMPHHKNFSTIRGRILAVSSTILQDDSGIPFRNLNDGRWRLRLFGDYEQPYGSFAYLEQPDLRKAYNTQSPQPLDFHIGYGFSRITSNLLLAKRLPDQPSSR